MILIYLLEPLLILLVLLVVITQIILPTFSGGRWFPLFRRADVHKTHLRVEEERALIEEQIETERLRLEVNLLRARLKAQTQQADQATTQEHP